MVKPLMPKATAVWLIQNTSLTFKQIADFCHLHTLEVQAIADEEREVGTMPRSPITLGQLTSDEIKRGEASPDYVLRMTDEMVKLMKMEREKSRKRAKYTPIVQRKDKPSGALWILQRHSDIKDSQIAKLLGMTKTTVESIRNKSHWNYENIVPKDPVILGLCSQVDLDRAHDAAERAKQ